MRILSFPEYPLPIVCGGIELRCLKTTEALSRIGLAVRLLDYYDYLSEYDVLHIFGNPPSIFELRVKMSAEHKFVLSCVCAAKKNPGIKEYAHRLLSRFAALAHQKNDLMKLRYVFKSADAVICLNQLEANYAINHYGAIAEKVHIVGNAVDDIFFSADPNPFVEKYGFGDFVLFTGNICQRKNPLLLAEALNIEKCKGVFIGNITKDEPRYVDSFRRIISESPNLVWIDGLNRDDPLLSSAYAASSVFALPSTSETQPQSALEAMAARKPVVLGDFAYAYQYPFCESVRTKIQKRAILQAIKKAKSRRHAVSGLDARHSWSFVAEEIARIYDGLFV